MKNKPIQKVGDRLRIRRKSRVVVNKGDNLSGGKSTEKRAKIPAFL